jgi:hypothetical protein
MFVILGRDAMSDCEEGLTEYLKGVWLKIRPGLFSVMLGIIILMNFLYVMIVLLKHWKND